MAPRRNAVFILPAEGYRIADFVEAADRLDVGMVIATDAHHGLAEDMGASLVPIDFTQPIDAAKRIAASTTDISAIVPIDDRGVGIAADAASLRRLPHNDPDSVLATRDKIELRSRLEGIVPQPRFAILDVEHQPPPFPAPWVVKPVGLAGSIGVIRVDGIQTLANDADRIRRIQAAHGYTAEHRLLIEEYVPGHEVAVEGLLTEGRWETLAIFDKPDPLEGPYFAETHYVTPTRMAPDQIDSIERTARRAVRHLGLVQGPVHAEFRVQADEITLLELAARPIGGLCGRALRFGLSDTSLEEVLVRNALGEQVRGTRPAPGASGVTMIPVPRAGTFDGIDGIAAAESVPGVTSVEVSAIAGSKVLPLPEESTYLGFIFARADRPQDVEATLRSARRLLEIIVR